MIITLPTLAGRGWFRRFLSAALPAVAVLGGCIGKNSSRDTEVLSDTVVFAAADTAGVEVPRELAAFCRPGARQLRPIEEPHLQRPDSGEAVPTARLYSHPDSHLETPVRCVVQREEDWTELWSAIMRGFADPPPPPIVDFGSQILLVAGMGTQPTTDYHIDISAVYRTADGLTAVVVHHPPGGCAVGMAESAPVHVARVPRDLASVRFVEKVYLPPPCPYWE